MRAILAKPVGLLPSALERRVRGAVLRFDNRAEERALAREVAAGEAEGEPHGGLPVPPALLRVRVSSWRAGREEWLESGELDARLIRELVARNGYDLERMGAILDFGCGCGRVLRCWSGLRGPEVHGADVDRAAIRWCRRNLPFVQAVRSEPLPPLGYPDERFDFVYALSVLTHLTEQAGRDWLAELVRILRPGGLLLFTVHGERFIRALSERDRRRFAAGEIVITESSAYAGTNRYGAFHPPSSVTGGLLPPLGVDLLDTVYDVPAGGEGFSPMPIQDNYLVRKRR
jgi:SAM-dependent methyltransferase